MPGEQPAGRPSVSIVVPVWNEEPRNLTALHAELSAALGISATPWELIVVDDASTAEATRLTLRALALRDSRVRILRHVRRCGQETALVTGWQAATGELVCTMDCDLENRPGDVPRLLALLREGYDFVLGSRRLTEWRQCARRRLISRCYSAVMSVRWGLHLQDWGCGFMACRRVAFEDLRDQLDRWQGGPLKVRFIRRAPRWRELDVRWPPRPHGRSGYVGIHFWWHALRMVVVGTTLPRRSRRQVEPIDPRRDGDTQGTRAAEPSEGDRVLLEEDDNLLRGLAWRDVGYAVKPFLHPEEYETLRAGLAQFMATRLGRAGIAVGSNFTLERYHEVMEGRDALHRQLARGLGRFSTRRLPIDVRRIEARISDICGVAVTARNPSYGWFAGLASVFGIRIVRPHAEDYNPLHRDAWLDRLRHGINIYVPLAGSNERSSLCVVPGSHVWRESEIERTRAGARINGQKFTVPAVIGSRRPLDLVRPNPQVNEVLVFSPYLIHGGAANLNPDMTRVSLEMRFWRVRRGRRR